MEEKEGVGIAGADVFVADVIDVTRYVRYARCARYVRNVECGYGGDVACSPWSLSESGLPLVCNRSKVIVRVLLRIGNIMLQAQEQRRKGKGGVDGS